MITKIFVYSKKDGLYLRSDKGLIDDLFIDLDDADDFTLTPPPDEKNHWCWVEDKWVLAPKSLELQQEERWDSLKNERSNKISSGVWVESTGKVFQTDNQSLTQYANIAGMIALDNYEPIEWKTVDNSFVLLTVEVFKELQKAINENTQSAFRIAEQNR